MDPPYPSFPPSFSSPSTSPSTTTTTTTTGGTGGSASSSSALFSSSEQTGFFGFLDAFPSGWDVPVAPVWASPPPADRRRSTTTTTASSQPPTNNNNNTIALPPPTPNPNPHLPPLSSLTHLPSPTHGAGSSAARSLLTTPQKRQNHILSEQKRRTHIRTSYATLSLMLEGPSSGPGFNPALAGSSGVSREAISGGQVRGKRGRARGGGKKQGKAGTLFRAVEYVKWLKNCTRVLREDVEELKTWRFEGRQPQAVA